MSVNADDILARLLGNLDKGIISAKEPKKKKEATLKEVSMATRRMDKPTLEAKRIIFLSHVQQCKCGCEESITNKWALVEMVDKWGNLHRTRFLTKENAESLERVWEKKFYPVNFCSQCFDFCDLEPVVDEDSKKDVVQVIENLDDAVDAIFAKLESTTKD